MNIPLRTIQGYPVETARALPAGVGKRAKRSRRFALYGLMLAFDCAAVLLGFLLANLMILGDPFSSPGMKLGGIAAPVFIALALNNRAYVFNALQDHTRGVIRAIMSLLASLALVLFMLNGLGLLKEHHPAFLGVAAGVGALTILAGRAVAAWIGRHVLADNPLSELMIVDGVPQGHRPGCAVVRAEDAGISPDVSDPYMLDRLGNMVRDFDKVTVACAPERRGDWALVLKGAAIEAEFRSDLDAIPAQLGTIKPLPMIDFAMKRLIDVAIVLPAILFLAPLMIIVAIAIKLESAGPVLFVQQRLGYGNRLFRMYKFRSMRTDLTDSTGQVSASRGDARVTRVGRLIRATSIDELPQLFNVLNGTMSLVGPRPHALGSTASDKLFWEIDRNYWLRHACMPGLTGLAQVRGFRGATDHAVDLENRLAADLEYVRNWSLWLDIVILFRTFGVVVHRNAF